MNTKCTESESWKYAKQKSNETRQRIAAEKRQLYLLQPVLCYYCKGVLPYERRTEKFCCRSCSVITNNRKRKDIRFCCICNSELNCRQSKVCSRECYRKYRQKLIDEKIQNADVASGTLRKYVFRNREHKCAICNNHEWNTQPIPLDVDHIDGNPQNNLLDNLRLLCKNCHAQTPTYGAKNMGNGRRKRRVFYKENGYS